MNCLFCQRAAALHNRRDDDSYNRYLCQTCQVFYASWREEPNKLIYYSFSYLSYQMDYWVDENRFALIKRTNLHELPYPPYTRYRKVLELNYLPTNITPQNVAQKLPTILTFL
jgi:hypothetical protein